MKNTSGSGVSLRWNTYIFADGVKQVGLSSGFWLGKKYLWLIKYGKYNFTYVLFASSYVNCGKYHEFGGGASQAQFGQDLTNKDIEAIKSTIDNSILYQGDDIEQAATYIQQKIPILAYWDVVITDPTVSYGYYICRSS